MISQNSLQDEMLKAYIQSVFNTYDTDRNGSLDVKEMTQFFNDLFRKLNINVVVTEAQSQQAIQSIDQNNDGLIDRQELLKTFKMLLAPKPNPPMQTNYGQSHNQLGNNPYGNQGGYNQPGYNTNQVFNNPGYNPQGYPNNTYGQNYGPGYGQGYPNQGGYNNNPNYPPTNYGQAYNPNPMYNTQPPPNQVPNQMYNTRPFQQSYNPYSR